MGRILAIDYGRKRTGLAVSDPLRIIANPLETVPTHTLMEVLKRYISELEDSYDTCRELSFRIVRAMSVFPIGCYGFDATKQG